jgi:hypothetical protein
MEDTPKQSRALPIGVAAGLAVAVFAVLFAIRGSDGKAPAEQPVAEKPAEEPSGTTTEPTPAPAGEPDAAAAVAAAEPDAAPPVAAAEPDAAAPVAAATPDAAPAAPTAVVLTFVVTPADAKPTITVDGKTLSSNRFAVAPGDSVKVSATAEGFVAFEKTVTASKNQPAQEVAIALKKEGASTVRKPPRRPSRPKVDL